MKKLFWLFVMVMLLIFSSAGFAQRTASASGSNDARLEEQQLAPRPQKVDKIRKVSKTAKLTPVSGATVNGTVARPDAALQSEKEGKGKLDKTESPARAPSKPTPVFTARENRKLKQIRDARKRNVRAVARSGSANPSPLILTPKKSKSQK